jgi:hypothetical protein
MKYYYGSSVARYFVNGLLLTLFFTFQVSAADLVLKEEAQNAGHKFVGKFGGYDEKEKLLWVDEDVLYYGFGVKVVGTATKLGLLSEIKLGEKVTAVVKSRGKKKIPMVIEIHRQ